MSTGTRIRDLRKDHRISQTELARFIHVSQATVTAWETGKAEPSSSALGSLADYFDVSTDYLVGRSSVKNMDSHDLEDVMSFDGQPLDEHDRKLLRDIARSIRANKE